VTSRRENVFRLYIAAFIGLDLIELEISMAVVRFNSFQRNVSSLYFGNRWNSF